MDVVVSDEAKVYIAGHGGVVFVSAHSHRCCTGPMTLFDTSTAVPDDLDAFDSLASEGIAVRFRGDPSDRPDRLTIELRGVLRRHLVASWDGSAYRLPS
jgi:hypothetical protein